MPTLMAHAFLAGDRAGRTLLLCLGLAALVLAGVAGIAAAAVRIADRATAAASDRAVRELRAAAICLHATLAEQRQEEARRGRQLDQIHELLDALLPELVARVGAVEQQIAGQPAWRGVAGWAMQVDRRLAAVQAGLPQLVHANGNDGGGGQSPLDFSDEALRAYFQGFYDGPQDRPQGGAQP
jgi:hypothetical protein